MPTRHFYVAQCFNAAPCGYVAVTVRQHADRVTCLLQKSHNRSTYSAH